MPALAQAFPAWSLHQSGMLQYIVWTALEKEGLGASLQVCFNLLVHKETMLMIALRRVLCRDSFGHLQVL